MAGRGLGTLTLDLAVKTGGFTAGLDKAGRALDARAKSMQRRAEQIGKAIGVALTAAAGAIAVGVKSAIDQADALNDLNVRLGISAEKLSGFAYAAKQSGTDIDALGIGFKRLAKNMAEALDPKSSQAELFKALDLKPIDEATGKLKSLEQFLPEVASKFKDLHDETLEAALAQELFGKSGADLLEFLNLGADGLDQMQSKLRDLGGELSQETLRAADEFNDKLNDLHTATNGLFTALAADLLPQLNALVGSMVDVAREGSDLRGAISALSSAFDYLAETGRGVNDTWRGLVSTGIALTNVADNLSRLNPSAALGRGLGGLFGGDADGWAENWREAGTAIEQARERLVDYGKTAERVAPKGFGKGIRGGGGKGFGGASAAGTPGDTSALYAMLGGGGGSTKKSGGKSDAEREAEQLANAYKRMNEQMAESIALYNQTGEAAKVRYQIEHGELAGLNQLQKDELILKAEKLDALAAEKKAREEAIKLEEEEAKAIEDHKESVARLLSDIAFETSLLGLNNEERERMIALRGLNGEATAEEAAQIEAAMKKLQAEREADAQLRSAMDDFRGSFEDTVTDVLTGAKSIGDAFKSLADTVAAQISRIIAQQLTTSLFGAPGSTGGGSAGGWLSSLFGMFLPKHAAGTDFAPGGPSIVGEHGPEIVTLPRGSQVIPNHKIGGASVTVQILGGTNARETAQQAANEVRRVLAFSNRS